MAPTKATRDLTAELAFLTRALKAPSLREAAGRLAERARTEGWSPLVRPTAAKAGSGRPGSRPARAWKSSTTTTPGR